MRRGFRRALTGLAALALVGAGVGWWVTAPDPLSAAELEGVTGDAQRGEALFAAAGCASCHEAPDAEASDLPVLAGGEAFASDFGTFRAPNISPSPQGIGEWSDAEVINAVMRGVDNRGRHLYPALPYAAYVKAEVQDMADIVAFIRTLPPSEAESLPHDLSFPFNVRRSVGAWKLLFMRDDWVLGGDLPPEVERGRYLVEALAHCGECHTPRNALGGLATSEWMGGAENPSGEGRIPAIDPGHLDWSEADIAQMLDSGFTPDFDVVGGPMAEVVRNGTSRLSDEDRAAIAAYLKAVPALSSPP